MLACSVLVFPFNVHVWGGGGETVRRNVDVDGGHVCGD